MPVANKVVEVQPGPIAFFWCDLCDVCLGSWRTNTLPGMGSTALAMGARRHQALASMISSTRVV